MSPDILRFMVKFSAYVSGMANSIFYFLSQPVSQLIADILPWTWLDELVISILPDFTLLELLVANVGLILAVSIWKWYKGIVGKK